MLKKLTLTNFVHFLDEQTFRFDDGPNIFIGENRSGKSCAFEAIRRCMSTSKNFFFSSSHRKTDYSIVICEYIDDRSITIFSCYVKVPSNKILVQVPTEENVVVKFVVEVETSKEVCVHVHVDILIANKDGYPVNESFKEGHGKLAEIFKQRFTTKDLLKCLDKHIVNTEEFTKIVKNRMSIRYNSMTDCETYLKENIDRHTVITEPMRSISPVQWTNSTKLENNVRTKASVTFHTEMQDRSEILTWFTDTGAISEVERGKVDKYFAILTDNSSLRFEKIDNVIQVVDNGNIVSLEKAPEGYLEAKICAILLSIDRFKTVCLEEPGRGMHTQMIERMRDLVLRNIRNKTIILITHIPTFLTSRNVGNISFFRRTCSANNGAIFTVVRGSELFAADENKTRRMLINKTRRMITNNFLATLFCARRVLLVEGESELMFMSALKSILLDNDTLSNNILAKNNSEHDKENFNSFLLSLHILPLNGEQNKLGLHQVCKALGLERYFILDFDAIIGDDGNGSKSTKKFFKSFNLQHLEGQFHDKGVTALEEEGIFVWKKAANETHGNRKDGTIEDALICLTELDKSETCKQTFVNNNVNLQWNRESRVKNKHKLFSSTDLTDENIDTVVQEVIKYSLEHTDSDVFRMITFLIKACFSLR